LLDHAAGQFLEGVVGGPAGGKLDEFVPVSGERQLEEKADNPVVIILDLPGEALAGVENKRLESVDGWRTLVADVSRSLTALEGGLSVSRLEQLADDVETDLFADVVLNEDED
jgi:hypothetical protein